MTKNILLISDLDDTLLGDEDALERFHEYFVSFSTRIAIAYASGRFFESVVDDIKTTLLPEPIAVLGGVGSAIHNYPGGELNQEWIRKISQSWSAAIIRDVLSQEPDLKLQPEEFQSEFKVSYFLPDASTIRLQQFRKRLDGAEIKADYVYSSNRDLDILPCGVNKGTASAYLAKSLGFAKDHVLVAGNSGNDTKLFEHGFHGIIVANAHDELKQYAANPHVYLSPHARADGVRDGLEHWLKKNANY